MVLPPRRSSWLAHYVLVGVMLAGGHPAAAQDRSVVEASAPAKIGITLYRDPDRNVDEEMNRAVPQGYALITERRQVTLPPGHSTIRFTGVAEGMVAVSAIVTGLPGGVLEKNRNASLLNPAALVDGTLGNRVTLTRANPVTGQEESEQAVVRTRADGGIVLQTSGGYEAVQCSGLPERLTFNRVPGGLSAQPVFSADTVSDGGGTYTVELTYLSWGFDWQAHYVATAAQPARGGALITRLVSWLTLLNDNGQSFPDAEVTVVAGRPNIVSDFEELAEPPDGQPIRLACWPLGDTAAGSNVALPPVPAPVPPAPPAPQFMARADSIVLTAGRMMQAVEEDLGDLKLYRVPEPVTVAAKGLKQIAFLDKDQVEWQVIHLITCDGNGEPTPAQRLLTTVNDRRHDLGMALPQGGVTVFEAGGNSLQLVGESSLRDHASGQDVELRLAESTQIFSECVAGQADSRTGWQTMQVMLTNASIGPAKIRLQLGQPENYRVDSIQTRLNGGQRVAEFTVPGKGQRTIRWRRTTVDR